MARAADETPDPTIQTTLIFPKDFGNSDGNLEATLEDLEKSFFSKLAPGKTHQHIYCELPWSIIDEDIALEDKLTKWFADTKSPWGLSFVAMVPFDAQRLPQAYRTGLEEFARASNSAVIVGRRETEEGDPPWLGDEEVLDFGRKLELFEDPIWPLAGEMSLQDFELPDFSKSEDEFQSIELPLFQSPEDRNSYRNFLIEIARGTFGKVWGAEVLWRPEPTGPTFAQTLSGGKIYTWKSDHPSLARLCALNGARLTISGQKIDSKNLQNKLLGQNRFFS